MSGHTLNLHVFDLIFRITQGPLVYFHTFGREFVVISDLEIAYDLFEHRSAIYATKPRLVSLVLFLSSEVY